MQFNIYLLHKFNQESLQKGHSNCKHLTFFVHFFDDQRTRPLHTCITYNVETLNTVKRKSLHSLDTICKTMLKKYQMFTVQGVGGALASWLVHSSLDRAVSVPALAGDIVLCSWVRHFTLTVPLSTQLYRWERRI